MTAVSGLTIRPIAPRDDAAIATIIRDVQQEFGAVGPGHSGNDPEIAAMSAAYPPPRAAYWVAEVAGVVVGGGGVGPLAGADDATCELRKMYFLPAARGHGTGRAIAERAIAFARSAGYARCYLETMTGMRQARSLYEKLGFARAPTPRGHTGHFSCDIWYEMDL